MLTDINQMNTHTQVPTDTHSFHITENAAQRIKQLLSAEENPAARLRISVLGGGCSGFQYNYDFDAKCHGDDLIFEKNGVEVVIDSVSIPFIEKSTLDFVETLGSAAFEIKNPNATANCGCGNSFSV